jgi:alpha-1,3-rhamnosyl/mannosyltransferase
MKVILGCDPLLAPLTGIGQYTNELAKGLSKSNEIDSLKFFAHGKFYADDIIQLESHETVKDSESPLDLNIFGKLRASLAKSELMVSAYSKIIPIYERYKLKEFKDCILHSPNFILPEFEGKKVVTIHDLSTIKFPEFHPKARVSFVNRAIDKSIKLSDHIITDSEFIKNELIRDFGVNETSISAIHLGVNNTFHPRTQEQCILTLSQYKLTYCDYFLFVSTVEPRKNLVRLLSAFENYRKNNQQGLPLVLIGGEGWNSQKEHQKIKELASKGWVKYLGYVPQAHLPIIYSGAKAMLFPSLYEGFGLPVAEALQSGINVMTSLNSAMSEFSKHNASLVNPLDIDDIERSIHQLSQCNNKGIINQSFDWKKTCDEVIAVYKTL